MRPIDTEALELHVAGMVADREPIAAPSGPDDIMGDPANREALAFLVEVATRPAQSIRLDIMLPEDLVQAIDRTANSHSRFLAKAARLKLDAVTPVTSWTPMACCLSCQSLHWHEPGMGRAFSRYSFHPSVHQNAAIGTGIVLIPCCSDDQAINVAHFRGMRGRLSRI